MKRIVKLTEDDLVRIVKKVISEQQVTGVYGLKPYYGKGGFINVVGKINLGKDIKWEIMVRKKWGLDKSITLTNQFKLG